MPKRIPSGLPQGTIKKLSLSLALLVAFVGLIRTVQARQWSDASGRMKIEAEFFAASSTTVVIKKRDGSMVALEIAQLSADDQKFVDEKQVEFGAARNDASASPETTQTRTSVGGFELRGRVIAFGRHDVTIQRIAGLVTVNGTALRRLNKFYRHITPKIVAKYADLAIKTEQDVDRWLRSLATPPPVFTVEGVLMKLEDGSESAVPFFLLSEKDLAVLSPGCEQWKAGKSSEQDRDRESFLMSTQASSYQEQKDAEAQAYQIQVMQLNLLAFNAGLTHVWEVYLVPAGNGYARPMAVPVTARDSLTAEQLALQNYPGYQVTGVRKASY